MEKDLKKKWAALNDITDLRDMPPEEFHKQMDCAFLVPFTSEDAIRNKENGYQ